MDGVKTAIIGFIFVCIILPHLIKNRPQYFMAVAVFLVGMLFHLLALLFSGGESSIGLPRGFVKLCLVVDEFCQLAAVMLLFLSAGGLTIGQLAGEFGRAYEVMRRGEDQKTVIIPLSSQRRPEPAAEEDDDEQPNRYEINTEPAAPPPPATPQSPPTQDKSGGTIPME